MSFRLREPKGKSVALWFVILDDFLCQDMM